MIAERLHVIRRRLDQLRSRDSELVAGAEHAYREDPALPPSTLDAIEQEYDFALPDEYRAFITTVHGGGAGPAYGLLSLRESTTDAPFACGLAAPFPLSADETGEMPAERANDDEGDPMGALPIADHGCGSYDMLVVSGEAAGTVWRYGDDFWVPQRANGRTIGFLDWYERWLFEAEQQVGEGQVPLPVSFHALELSGGVLQTVHVATGERSLRDAIERFCTETGQLSWDLEASRRLGIWTFQRGAATRFLDLRPHLDLVSGDERVCLAQDDVARRLRAQEPPTLPKPGRYRLASRWSGELPSLETPTLAEGASTRILSPLPRDTTLPWTIHFGAQDGLFLP